MNCFGSALLHSVIGSKFSHIFFNQSEVKPKPIMACACTFSCALCWLHVITTSSNWFTRLCPIGQSNCFGFGFTTLDWNSLLTVFSCRHPISATYNNWLSEVLLQCWFSQIWQINSIKWILIPEENINKAINNKQMKESEIRKWDGKEW